MYTFYNKITFIYRITIFVVSINTASNKRYTLQMKCVNREHDIQIAQKCVNIDHMR